MHRPLRSSVFALVLTAPLAALAAGASAPPPEPPLGGPHARCPPRPFSACPHASGAACALDVRAFGAAGDGLADDTAAIQCAIDAASDRLRFPSGAAVYLPSGRYRLSLSRPAAGRGAALTVAAPRLRLFGDGDSTVLFVPRWAGASPPRAAVLLVGSAGETLDGVRIEELQLQGAPGATAAALAAAAPAGSSRAAVSTALAAVQLGLDTGTARVVDSGVRSVRFQGTGTAVRLAGGQPAGAQATGNFVLDSRFLDLDGAGVATSTGQADTLVQRNLFRRLAGVAVSWSGTRGLIQGNVIDGAAGGGIAVEQDDAQAGWSVIGGNAISDTGDNGSASPSAAIQLGEEQGAFRVSVEGNTVRTAWGNGIWVAGNHPRDLVIQGNVVDGFGLAGVSAASAGISAANVRGGARVTGNFVRCQPSGGACAYGVIAGGGSGESSYTDGNQVSGVTARGGRAFLLPASTGLNGAGSHGQGGRSVFNGRNVDLDTGAGAPDSDYTNHPSLPLLSQGGGAISASVGGARAWWIYPGADGAIARLSDGTVGEAVTLWFSGGPGTISVPDAGPRGPFDLQGDFATRPGRSAVLVLLCAAADPPLWVEVSRSIH